MTKHEIVMKMQFVSWAGMEMRKSTCATAFLVTQEMEEHVQRIQQRYQFIIDPNYFAMLII